MVTIPESQDFEKSEHRAHGITRMSKVDTDSERLSEDSAFQKQFDKIWRYATDDGYLTLFGFRRFRTTHLINLRFLEEELGEIDHQIFQAGMKLGHPPSPIDRLGLKHGKKDSAVRAEDNAVNRELVLRLRTLLKQYGL